MQYLLTVFLLVFVTTSTMAAEKKPLVFSVHPFVSAQELHKNFSPLIGYLENKIGRKIEFTVAKTYEDNMAALGEDLADIVYIGPAAYVVMSEKYSKKRILACLSVNGKPTFKGYIFTKTDNPATKIADLAGKTFASSSTTSTMSYVVARYLFIEAGVPFPEKQLQLRGNHNNIALAVLAGDVNAGAAKEKTFHKYQARGLKTITITPEIFEHPFVAGNTMDDATYSAIKQALLAITTEQDVQMLLKPIKKTVTGLSEAKDSDYDNLRAIMRIVSADEAKGKQ
ncbi:MAG: phosphate/phosphite/phosphonate ABC transporter substrate-binding protein [Desulfobulbaceae bacterium]|nr:phosphate/phosphite/phosphonate ABC transporter substrate-binding protein [Desulfobulbaceae bacterium]